MRPIRVGVAAVVAALSVATACGSKDATGPSISLSQEEVLSLGAELGGAINAISFPSGSLHGSASCPIGGSVSTTGSYGEGNTPAGDSVKATAAGTVTLSACRTAHYRTDGSLQLTGGATVTASSTAANATAMGTLTVTASDGRSGACDIDVAVSFVASGFLQPAYVVTGSACGVDVGGTYH